MDPIASTENSPRNHLLPSLTNSSSLENFPRYSAFATVLSKRDITQTSDIPAATTVEVATKRKLETVEPESLAIKKCKNNEEQNSETSRMIFSRIKPNRYKIRVRASLKKVSILEYS